MLAGFYASAVLLRYEYPMMIITKTKEIFLKRLKRNKKMLTEEGSSDESKSATMSRSIQLHTNTFLSSVNSSQLSKKTQQLRNELFPEFKQKRKQQKSFDSSIHDIHNPLPSFENSIVEKKQVLEEESFADKLMKLSKNISLNEMIDCEAVQVNLLPTQNDVQGLICDFDEIDKQITIKNFEKLRIKQKQNINQQYGYFYTQQEHLNAQKFKKKSKLIITPIDEQGQYLNHEKTLQNPKSRRLPKEMQYSVMEREMKTKNLYQESNQHYNNSRGQPKMSAFYQTKNSVFLDSSEERLEKHEQSYKTLQRFKPSVNVQKANEHELRHVYNGLDNRGKTNSYHENYLPRHRSNNVINIRKSDEMIDFPIENRPKQSQFINHPPYPYQHNNYPTPNNQYRKISNQYNYPNSQNAQYQNTDPYYLRQQSQKFYPEPRRSTRQEQHNPLQHEYHGGNPKFTIKNKLNHPDDRFVTEFDLRDHPDQGTLNSPRFRNAKDQEHEESKFSIYSKQNQQQRSSVAQMKYSHLPVTTENFMQIQTLDQNSKFTSKQQCLPTQKPIRAQKYVSPLSNHHQIEKFPQPQHSNIHEQHKIQENLAYTQQSTLEEKQEKKKRIREKAAQLLSRVKSHEYLTTRMDSLYAQRY